MKPAAGGAGEKEMPLRLQGWAAFAFIEEAAILRSATDTPHWKSKALRPAVISSRPSGRVTGGSARARQPTRSQSRQAGPTGVVRSAEPAAAVRGSAAP